MDNKRVAEVWNQYEKQTKLEGMIRQRDTRLYYRIINEIKTENKLWFIIRGNLRLEDNKEYWIDNDICFYTAYDDNPDPSHKSDKKIIQYRLGLVDIEGYCKINTSGKQDEAIITSIEKCVMKIQKTTDFLSMVFRTSLEWYPARKIIKNDCGKPFILYEMSDNTAFTVPKNSRILEVIEEYKLLNGIKNKDITVVDNLISWLALANSSQSVTYSFLVYWQVIELLAKKIYKNNKTKSEKKDECLHELKSIDRDNVLPKINECYRIVNGSIKEKVKALINDFYADDKKRRDDIRKDLIQNGESLYKVRNDIAHGNADVNDYLVNHDFDRKLSQIKKISYEITIKYIEKVTSAFREKNKL